MDRLGFIVPSANAVFENDVRRLLPARYPSYVARVSCARDSEDELARLARNAPAAARDLRDADVAAIAFACTSGSLLGGFDDDSAIGRAIAAAAEVPATTAATAVREALASLGVSDIALVTPYEDWLNERVVTFLSGHGVRTSGVFGFATPEVREHEQIPPERIADEALSLCGPEVQAVLISCTSFRGAEAAELVRQAQDRPVVSSNEATLWAAMRLVGAAAPAFAPLQFTGDEGAAS